MSLWQNLDHQTTWKIPLPQLTDNKLMWYTQVVASGNLQWSSLLEANFAAAPQSIPIIALSFVYQVILFTIRIWLRKIVF
jgi:hypothetical protein